MRNMLQIGHDSRKKHMGRKYMRTCTYNVVLSGRGGGCDLSPFLVEC